MDPESGLDSLKGIGEKTKQIFAGAGITNVGELLGYYPRAWEQYEEPKKIAAAEEGELVSIAAVLTAPVQNRYIRGRCISSVLCSDGSNELLLSWYHMPYLKNSLRAGESYIFRGKIKKKGQRLSMEQPAVFHAEQYEKLTHSLQPVYSLSRGMSKNMVQKAVRQALGKTELTKEYLPDWIRKRYKLCDYGYALEKIHFPDDQKALTAARRRLVFDEFFFFVLQLKSLKEQHSKDRNHFVMRDLRTADRVIAALPYELTGAQKRVWEELKRDMMGDWTMSRLIQGDVGSGKTILAVLALIMTAENGYQGAMMAPTEVLAKQHYEAVKELLTRNRLPYKAALLTGSMTAARKREVYEKMKSGELSILIGTHALFQEKAVYRNLALVITDEQHRFGVRQRESLQDKGCTPHTLVMSATPIPRTLAVILYGDLDISVLDELPANRLPIKNCVVGSAERPKAWRFIEKQVRLGHQAYVICPMVTESDAVDAENVVSYSEELKEALPKDISVAFLHGRMKAQEKNEIMERFLANDIQVLVSTTVVEVGVNVPNATVMLIENAERFGLAQLHQLRGRVGRGNAQSYCIFLHAADNARIEERLDILNHSNDGFEIANQDLKLRGPGDLFGVRQSGMMDFQLADVYADAKELQQANEAAGLLLAKDPQLEKEENRALRERCDKLAEKREQRLNL